MRAGVSSSAFEPSRPVERRGPPQPVGVAHRVGDLHLRVGRDLLADQRHREDRRQVVRSRRLHRARVQRRQRVAGEVGQEVDPVGGDPVLGERELDGLGGDGAILRWTRCKRRHERRSWRSRSLVVIFVPVVLVLVLRDGRSGPRAAGTAACGSRERPASSPSISPTSKPEQGRHGGRGEQVTLECLDRDGAVVYSAPQAWPFLETDGGTVEPHAHAPMPPEALNAHRPLQAQGHRAACWRGERRLDRPPCGGRGDLAVGRRRVGGAEHRRAGHEQRGAGGRGGRGGAGVDAPVHLDRARRGRAARAGGRPWPWSSRCRAGRPSRG